MEQKRLEEELHRKEEECQRDLVYCIEVDCVAAIEQQCRKNWSKMFLSSSSPPSDKDMNLIDLLPLIKRQRVQYLPKETPEAHQQHQELAREIGVSAISGGSPCKRCMDFGILYIPQNLPWVFCLIFFVTLLTLIVTQHHALLTLRLRLPVSLLTQIKHMQRLGQKWSRGQKQGRQSNKQIRSGK